MSASLVRLHPPSAADAIVASGVRFLSPERRLRRLRISVTDRCNFRCRHCTAAANEGHAALELEDLADLAAWLVARTGIETICLAGGEPLLRPGIGHLVARLSSLPQVRAVSLSTNGSLLSRMAWALKAAGLSRVNVTLASLDAERFTVLTGGGRLADTLAGIDTAYRAGLRPVRLDTVLRHPAWRQDVPRLLEYAGVGGFGLRLIERAGAAAGHDDSEFVTVDTVQRELGIGRTPPRHAGTTGSGVEEIRFPWRTGEVQVGWVARHSRPAPPECDGLWVDASGQLRRSRRDGGALDLPRVLSAGPDAADKALAHYVEDGLCSCSAGD